MAAKPNENDKCTKKRKVDNVLACAIDVKEEIADKQGTIVQDALMEEAHAIQKMKQEVTQLENQIFIRRKALIQRHYQFHLAKTYGAMVEQCTRELSKLKSTVNFDAPTVRDPLEATKLMTDVESKRRLTETGSKCAVCARTESEHKRLWAYFSRILDKTYDVVNARMDYGVPDFTLCGKTINPPDTPRQYRTLFGDNTYFYIPSYLRNSVDTKEARKVASPVITPYLWCSPILCISCASMVIRYIIPGTAVLFDYKECESAIRETPMVHIPPSDKPYTHSFSFWPWSCSGDAHPARPAEYHGYLFFKQDNDPTNIEALLALTR